MFQEPLHKLIQDMGYSCSSMYQPSPKPDNDIRSLLPGLRRKQVVLLLSGQKSTFLMEVNVKFNMKFKFPECGERVEINIILDFKHEICSCASTVFYQLNCLVYYFL